MTALPSTTGQKLGLVIDLDTCVGCQACATSCKEWNTGGYSAPLTDSDPYGKDPDGAWLNRVHSYDIGEGATSLATGDGANDIPMLEAATYGVAYYAKPKARAAAHGWIDRGDLTSVLQLLGIPRGEWVWE